MSSIPNFPDVKTSDYNNYGEGVIKKTRTTEFENNTVSSRPKAGEAINTFRVGWSSLPDADYELVKSFFAQWNGYAFNFTPPGKSTPVLCMFTDEKIDGSAVGPDPDGRARWRLIINLRECTDSAILVNAGQEE